MWLNHYKQKCPCHRNFWRHCFFNHKHCLEFIYYIFKRTCLSPFDFNNYLTQTWFLDCKILLNGLKNNTTKNGIILWGAITHWESLKALRTCLSRWLLLEVTSGSLWSRDTLGVHCSSPSSRGSSTRFNSFSRICSCQTSSTTEAEKTHPLKNHSLLTAGSLTKSDVTDKSLSFIEC